MQRKSLEKIVLNVGLGRISQDSNFKEKILPAITEELALITGQKPAPRKARKSIASFKIRQGDVIGLQVTLRGRKMRDFLSRLVNVTLPRVRDFRGIDLKQMDGQGNLSIGIRDYMVFPEVNQEKSKFNFGLQVTLVPTSELVKEGREIVADFYRSLGVPLRKDH